LLPAEYIGFIINIADTNELNELLGKIKNILQIVLKSSVEFNEIDKYSQRISESSPLGKLSITPVSNDQLKLVLQISSEQTAYGYFTSIFNDSVLTNTVYEFLQFLAELIRIQATKIELHNALMANVVATFKNPQN
jgi:hypothetical protein